MVLNGSYFKKKGRAVLKGDLQTALLVSFFSGCFLTLTQVLLQVLENRLLQTVTDSAMKLLAAASNGTEADMLVYARQMYAQLESNLAAVPVLLWVGLGLSVAAAVLVTPALKLGEAGYYLDRLRGQNQGVVQALTSRFKIFWKALGLYALIILKLVAWGLIYVPVALLLNLTGAGSSGIWFMLAFAAFIPEFIAYLRYSMAPYYLAEHTDWGAMQSIRASKDLMKDKKTPYFLMLFSFVLWQLLLIMAESLLSSLGLPSWIVMVAALFGSLMISVYMTATTASFYDVLTTPSKAQSMNREMQSMMRQMGMSEEDIRRMNGGENQKTADEEPGSGKPGDEDTGKKDENGNLN